MKTHISQLLKHRHLQSFLPWRLVSITLVLFNVTLERGNSLRTNGISDQYMTLMEFFTSQPATTFPRKFLFSFHQFIVGRYGHSLADKFYTIALIPIIKRLPMITVQCSIGPDHQTTAISFPNLLNLDPEQLIAENEDEERTDIPTNDCARLGH